jgi:putative cell wall-binding protein
VRSRVSALVVLALAAALLVLPAPEPSEAAAPRPSSIVPVAPGVSRAEYRLSRANGSPVAAQVLTVSPSPEVRLVSALAQGAVPGLETVRDMNRRLEPDGAVAVINSSFWLNRPVGDPESYFATGGRLISESETQGATQRGTFALTPEGLPLMDRVFAQVHLNVNGEVLLVTGLNRLDKRLGEINGEPHPQNDPRSAVYLYTPEYGGQVTLPSPFPEGRDRARAMILPGMDVPASDAGVSARVLAPAAVEAVPGQTLTIPRDGVVLVAYNGRADEVGRIVPGTPLTARTRIETEATDPAPWGSVAEGVAAGPLLVRDRRVVDPATWEQEGFSAAGHSNVPAPRSAVGFDADGRVFLVAVDGRQPGHSAGMTMMELARFLIDLGAVHGMALDGGGSTQLAVDGVIRNQPCQGNPCGPLRPVASGIVVEHDYPYERTRRLSGAGREDTAAEIARATYPDGAGEAVLAPAADFPDALAGGPLAAQLGAPLLLAGKDALAPATRGALRELGVRRVTLLGGTAAIGPEVAARLEADGYAVRRVAGAGRVETAAAIANAMGTAHPRVFVAAAGGFADALSAAAPAGIMRAPILLTGQETLSAATAEVVAASRPVEVIVVGGTGVIAARVEQELQALNPAMTVRRLSGPDRFGTAETVNRWAEATIPDLDATGLVVARGDTFPDALAGGPFAAAQRRLLMIVPSWDVRAAPASAAYLDARGDGPLAEVDLLGGSAVLSSYQKWQLDQLAQ